MTDNATALGLLATVVVGVGGFGALMLRTLLADVLATNRALREALVSLGQRFATHVQEEAITADMVEDIHRATVGAKRTSDYSIAREQVRRARDNRETGT